MKKQLLLAVFLILVSSSLLFSGTTGKIAGVITDSETGDPLIGVNVVIEGTLLGTATDKDGYFVILNVPPGKYTVKASYIGYVDYTVTDARVNIDLTTTLDMRMKPTVIAGEEVTVVAERPVVQKDVSASTANIESSQIDALPVQSLDDVVGLQAGIQGLSIRGGGSDELAFMVDGITLRDERDNSPITGVSLSAIQDVQIQTGGFNAEYGNVRSGVITVVTKEGDPHHYSGTIDYENSPPAAKHFGKSFNDPNSYWLRPYLDPAVAFVGTENGSWDEAMQAQYPSFQGWNAISKLTLSNNDPSDDLTPQAAQRLFTWQHRRQLDITKPDYIIDAGFGGPIPLVSQNLGKLRFYASYRGERQMYMIPLSRDAYLQNNFQIKLTSDITNSMKLTIAGFYNKREGTPDNDTGQPGLFTTPSSEAEVFTDAGFTIASRFFFDSYWAISDVDRYNISLKLNHTLSPSTFYEAKLEHTRTKYFTRPGAERDTSRKYQIVPGYFVDEAPFGSEEQIVTGVDGMLMGVRPNAHDSSKISTTTFKFDLTSQLNKTNLVKTGLEIVYDHYNMNFGAINKVLPEGRPWTRWDRNPIRGSLYLQDKLEFQGFISNIGLRLDYIDPQGKWYDISYYDNSFFSRSFVEGTENQFQQKAVDKQLYLSPRLGVSYPVSATSKLYFNYGHFRQMPESDRLYNVRRATDNSVIVIGDPNLPLQRTVAYELGFEQSLWNAYLIRIAGYYKDISDQPNLVTVIGYGKDSGVNYSRAASNFYEDIRGAEFTVEKRRGSWFRGFLNYTYMVSTNGYFDARQLHEQKSQQKIYLEEHPPSAEANKPIARPYFRGNLIINTPAKFGTEIGGFRPFANWLFSFLGSWQSGRHFTWTNNVTITGIQNNMQWQDYYNVDLRISRDFDVKPFRVKFFVNVTNLFNFKIWSWLPNVAGVPSGFVDGDDYTKYMRSLRLPKDLVDNFKYVPENGYGDDQPGDYRPDDVAYDPLEPNPNNDPDIEKRNQERIKNKSYIDNPGMTDLQFLNPRDIYLGIKLSFDF
jgi:outer membrane receptor protein involved in Fe transport